MSHVPDRTNLPLQLTSFVGRDREIAELRQLLEDGGVRLLTLVGPGGIGKTRLALQVARDLVPTRRDGTWLVELAALHDPSLLPNALASVLDIRERPPESIELVLTETLRNRDLLLVLDNCEHLASACAALAGQLLTHCPGLRIVATARQSLGLVGETTWRVPPLSMPDPRSSSAVDEIAACEAVRLFVDRGRMSLPSFALTERNAQAVGAICRRLDGIPLAIELAAARVSALGVEQILARLDDRFRLLLNVDRAGVPERQRTLRATVEWSHELLAVEDRVLFRRLSVFAGGWSLEAAESVCSGGTLESDRILDGLSRLVDRSLVVAEGQESVARYSMLETLREYALDKLREADEEAELRDRQLALCVDLAEQATARLNSAEQAQWLRMLEQQQDNIRAALGWALQRGEVEMELQLAGAMGYFWEIRGHRFRAQGLAWLERGLNHPRADSTSPPVKARALYWAGTYAYELFQFDHAADLLDAALGLYATLEDTRGMAETLLSLGTAARIRGDYERAATAFDDGLRLMQQHGDQSGVAQVKRQRARLERATGHSVDAQRIGREALTLFLNLGESHQAGHVCDELGETARDLGLFDEAAHMHARGAELLGNAGCEEGVSSTRYHLACLALAEGDTRRAAVLAAEALEQMRDIGVQRESPACLEVLAAAIAADDPGRALQFTATASTLRFQLWIAIPHADREMRERVLAVLRARIGEPGFAEAWEMATVRPFEDVLRLALTPAAQPASQLDAPGGLSPREREVAALLSRGMTNREIAEALVITERTTEAHVTHVLGKLGLRSRAQVAVWALEHGLRD